MRCHNLHGLQEHHTKVNDYFLKGLRQQICNQQENKKAHRRSVLTSEMVLNQVEREGSEQVTQLFRCSSEKEQGF
jgi:hypothetical protein